MILQVILGILAVLSCALTLWQFFVARKFPLHERVKDASYAPSVTLLKPLKGCDAETKECLRSWLQQNYRGEIQILFGVASPDDPVCEVARELIASNTNAKRPAELVICADLLGPNAKVSSLIHLSRRAKNELIIVSDADVRVPLDFLANIVQPLQKTEVGLVNCFYRYANPTTLAMQWEAIAVNADFWSQVLQSQSLKPIDFALGAVMATRRENLKEIGGFESLVDYLADDYQLGNRIAKTGKQITISPMVVECWESPKTWLQVLKHQFRWAITIRACQPVPFFFSILSNGTLWPLLLFLVAPFSDVRFTGWEIGTHRMSASATGFHILHTLPLIMIGIRVVCAVNLENRLTRSTTHFAFFWLVPLKDLLNVFIWAASFAMNQVEWRGEKYRVLRGGKLQKI